MKKDEITLADIYSLAREFGQRRRLSQKAQHEVLRLVKAAYQSGRIRGVENAEDLDLKYRIFRKERSEETVRGLKAQAHRLLSGEESVRI